MANLRGNIVFALGVILTLTSSIMAQQQSTDVIRVNTDLVQTSLMVVDRNGKFVEGLTKEQFELRVDGQPRSIDFFEQVFAGSAKELQLAGEKPATSSSVASNVPVRGRTIVFFIDDLHLSLQSLDRTRAMLRSFIDQEMSPRDQVAIVSASGQIGFLQQFTNNRAVAKAAVSRLNHRPYIATGYGTGKTPITEYVAQIIETRSDTKVVDFYVEECLKQTNVSRKSSQLMAALRATCLTQVKNSARAILAQAADITKQTYGGLESLMKSSARRPGRKLAFFVSDGFMLQTGLQSSLSSQLLDIIASAQRAGVVVYTIDAKGLVSGNLDATNSVPADAGSRLVALATREIAATQDALHALAVDTGGRALRNSFVFDRWVSEILQETSKYYLLAWRPDSEEQKEKKFRKVQVSIIGRTDLSVRLPKGYTRIVATSAAAPDEPVKTPARMLGDALTDYQPNRNVPIDLSLTYLNTPTNGIVLTCSTQIATHALGYGDDGKKPASVDLAGVVLNDAGKVVTSFKNRLNAKPLPLNVDSDRAGLIYNHPVPLAPGIYQVRVAVRDEHTGLVGSAMDWLAIPEMAEKQLTLSSLLLGGKILEKGDGASPLVQFSVDHRFARQDKLNFWIFVYNAGGLAPNISPSRLAASVEVLRDGRPIMSINQQSVNTNGVSDPARIPYTGDLPLNKLDPGSYELRVTVSNLSSGIRASQVTPFEVQ
jgi:VWFA-related protein